MLSQVDSKTHPVAPQSKLPEVFAQLDSKLTHMMKAVSAALAKDDRGVGSAPSGGSSGVPAETSTSKDVVRAVKGGNGPLVVTPNINYLSDIIIPY